MVATPGHAEENRDSGAVRTGQAEEASRRGNIKVFFLRYGLLLITVLLFIAFAYLHPRFATTRNIFNLVSQGSLIGLLALGLTNIIVVGEFDISFAAAATLVSIMSFIMIGDWGINIWVTWGICILLGTGVSLVNAVNVVYTKIPSFIATLGMMGIILGAARWITGGSFIYYPFLPPVFAAPGRGLVAGIVPVPVIIFMAGTVAIVIFLEYTFMGRYFYAVGDSTEAARRAGIGVRRAKFLAFLVMGIIIGIAGIMMASIFNTARPELGENYLFPAITAAFLGAVFFREGQPNALGTVAGAMLLAILSNGMTMMGVALFLKQIVQGLIFIAAVLAVSTLKKGGIPGIRIG